MNSQTRINTYVEGDGSPEDLYQSLPTGVKDSICKCITPNWIEYYTLIDWVPFKLAMDLIPSKERGQQFVPLGMFCSTCVKPGRYTIFSVTRICEGCESYYVPKPIEGTYPLKYRLCSRCDRPVRPRRKSSN